MAVALSRRRFLRFAGLGGALLASGVLGSCLASPEVTQGDAEVIANPSASKRAHGQPL